MRHFLSIADYSRAELIDLLDLADSLKQERKNGGNPPLLENKVLGMIFQKPSLRTRVSFDMAMRHLGGDALYISPNEIGLGQRESIADVSRVISRYVDVVMARVFDHDHVLELAKHASIPVINGLSDFNHPCQALADVLTIRENHPDLGGIKVSFIGDGNNVAVSLLFSCAKLGMNFSIATPEGYELPNQAVGMAEEMASETGSSIEQGHDPNEAALGAQVLYTDTWVSMGQEDEVERRTALFQPFQVNRALLARGASDAIVMHCLPAHRGQEITDEVADSDQSVIFDQAENRMHAQKAVLVTLLN
jgi:ornithine carbamoyltransferase